MIVDDEDEVREVMARACRQAGYQVLMADNGLRLVATLKSEPVDLVLLDINMPWISGLQLGKAIKEDPKLSRVKVIFITGLAEREKECRETGCDGFLHKPVKTHQLLAEIRNALHGKPV